MNNDKLTPEELLAQQQREAGAAAAQATGNPLYKSAADFDARFTRMLADEERKEREEQEKRIQRQQAAQAVSDAYSGIFNDVLKAHQGALVTPRDVQQRYDRLDERQKQIYDNYRARMAAIRKQAQDRAAGNLGVAQRAKEKQDEMDLRWKIAAEQEAGRNQRAAEANQNRYKIAQERAAKTVTRTGGAAQDYVVEYAGQKYTIPKNVFDSRMANLYAYMDKNNLFTYEGQREDALDGIMAILSAGNNTHSAESSKAKLAIAVLVALDNIPPTSEHYQEIVNRLSGVQGTQPAATPKTPETNTQTTATETQSGSLYTIPTKK